MHGPARIQSVQHTEARVKRWTSLGVGSLLSDTSKKCVLLIHFDAPYFVEYVWRCLFIIGVKSTDSVSYSMIIKPQVCEVCVHSEASELLTVNSI